MAGDMPRVIENSDHRPKMRTTILDLPPELIATIVSYLPSDSDVFNVRLSDQYLERSSISHFGKHHFRKKGYMLSNPSLEVLDGVSQHRDLRKYVQHVWLNPDCYTFVTPECAPDPQESPDPDNTDSLIGLLSPSDQKKYKAYQGCMIDHHLLLEQSAANLQQRLTSVFATLPNLETVGMRRSEDHKPWGWRQLKQAVGEDPRVLGPIPSGPMSGLSGPTKLFLAIVSAAAATDLKLRRLYTDAIEIDDLRPDLLTQEKLNKACNSIWYLEVNVTKAHLYQKKRTDAATHIAPSDYGNGLVRLLKATPDLKEIGLQIFPDRKQSHLIAPSYRNPESWRDSYPYLCLDKIVQSVRLPHLTRIKLEKVTTSPTTLLSFLSSCQSNLTSLKIRDVRLLSDDRHPRPWQPILHFLSTACPQLSYLLLYHLMYDAGGISFTPDPPMPLPPSETDPTTGAPNPAFGTGTTGGELFTKYEHIALEMSGREEVGRRLPGVVEGHWYQKPMFSYAMDEGVWHTDTSEEEW